MTFPVSMLFTALATPRFLVGNTLNGTILRPITGNRVELKCFAQGTPKPKIYWFKVSYLNIYYF